MSRVAESVSGQSITRLLVMSYFIALSLGLIGDGRIMTFMMPVLPENLSENAMRAIVLTLSILILIGIARRTAALTLSIVIFFASYSTLYLGGDVSDFWRDLALIGAVLLTTDLYNTKIDDDVGRFGQRRKSKPSPATKASKDVTLKRDDQEFRKDFDIARAN
ncbi:MAG: hypothetical protein AAF668_16735 [Pseudomonadota bacterium]